MASTKGDGVGNKKRISNSISSSNTSTGSATLPLTLDDMTDEQREEFNIEVRRLAREGFFQRYGLSNSQVQKTLDRLNRNRGYEPVEVEADEWEERTPLEEIPEFDPTFKKATIFDSIRTKRGKRDTIDWQNKGLYKVEYQVLKFEHEENGEKPSVREIFYRLEANGLIVKTKWAYGTYDDVVTDAIKRGWLPPDLFAEDDTRPDIELWWVWFPHQWADMKANEFKNAVDSYYQPLWYRQPKFVVVITEKVALKPALHNVCDPLQVPVGGNRGWAGLRYLWWSSVCVLLSLLVVMVRCSGHRTLTTTRVCVVRSSRTRPTRGRPSPPSAPRRRSSPSHHASCRSSGRCWPTRSTGWVAGARVRSSPVTACGPPDTAHCPPRHAPSARAGTSLERHRADALDGRSRRGAPGSGRARPGHGGTGARRGYRGASARAVWPWAPPTSRLASSPP
jgi:hypothetical protein